mgnify:CR=1 FL=1
MSGASQYMKRNVSDQEQAFGYVCLTKVSLRGYGFSPIICEVCLRSGRQEIALTLQIDQLDTNAGRYNLLVGLAEAMHEEDCPLFLAAVDYFDALYSSVVCKTLLIFNDDISGIIRPIVLTLHAIIYEAVLYPSHPPSIKGVTNVRWGYGFDREQKSQIESRTDVRLADLIEEIKIVIPCL